MLSFPANVKPKTSSCSNFTCVRKRDGTLSRVSFDAIQQRVEEMQYCGQPLLSISPAEVCKSIMPQLYNEIPTEHIDQMMIEYLMNRTLDNPEYEELARRLHVNSTHKRYRKTFHDAMLSYKRYPEMFTSDFLHPSFEQFVIDYSDELEALIDYSRDYDLNLRAHLVLGRSYLMRAGRDGELFEVPQQLFMRVAVALWCDYLPFVYVDQFGRARYAKEVATPARSLAEHDPKLAEEIFQLIGEQRSHQDPPAENKDVQDNFFSTLCPEAAPRGAKELLEHVPGLKNLVHRVRMKNIQETYEMMSRGLFIHATPILMSAGMARPSLLSCFIGRVEDSVDGMYSKVHECALIQKSIGGIGLDLSNIRPASSHIRSTGERAAGLIPYVRVLQGTAAHVQQGGKRRANHNYNVNIYQEEVLDMLDIRSPMAPQEVQLPDAHYSLWVDKHFFECVDKDQTWYFFDPSRHPRVFSTWGEQRRRLVQDLVAKNEYSKKMGARELWQRILKAEWETQEPFLISSDNVESLNVQTTKEPVRALNLCVEMTLVHDEKNTAVCCLGSLKLSSFVDQTTGKLDTNLFMRANQRLVKNLNRVLDINHYPTVAAMRSAMKDRPLGIGVQDLAGLFMKLGIPYLSDDAKVLGQYLAALQYISGKSASMALSTSHAPCARFQEMPAASGKLKPLEWCRVHSESAEWLLPQAKKLACLDNYVEVEPVLQMLRDPNSGIPHQGLRNSTLEASMPTVSTAQILGSVESFEPVYANVYMQRLIDREHVIINPHLVSWLKKHDLLHGNILHQIKQGNGSVRQVKLVDANGEEPSKQLQLEFQRLFTCWTDLDFDHLGYIDLQAARAMFIDQSLSMNHVVTNGDLQTLNDIYRWAEYKGLPTLSYYTRKVRNDQALDHLGPSKASADLVAPAASPSSQGCGEYCAA